MCIHINFVGPFQQKMFMLIVDAHPKWPEIIEMPKTTSKLRSLGNFLLHVHGLPEQVVAGNGPQFTAEEFTVFLKQSGKTTTCSPYHPSSNGAVERFVQIV